MKLLFTAKEWGLILYDLDFKKAKHHFSFLQLPGNMAKLSIFTESGNVDKGMKLSGVTSIKDT